MTDMNNKTNGNDDELRKSKTDEVMEKVADLSDDEIDMASGGVFCSARQMMITLKGPIPTAGNKS